MTAPLVPRLRQQAAFCDGAGSPLMRALLEGAADDLAAGGPVADLLGPLEDDPPGSVPALRFAGALHRLVLERRAPLLATHYPSVGGTAPVEEVWSAARDAVVEHLELLRLLMRRSVQTNEVGRAAALLGALALLSEDRLPVRLLEVGASAGLNLLADRFALRVEGVLRGDPGSPVVLDEPWQGVLPPDRPVEVVERRGCDPAPLDARSTEDRLTLTSYVWADQADRFARLRGAFAVADRVGVRVLPLPASVFLGQELASPRPGVRTVVWHSVVRQYLTPQERADVDLLLDEAGARATPEAPLVRLTLEPERVGDATTGFQVRAQTWPGGQTTVLADAEAHGPPVVWRPPPA
ncbi:MAG: hypothetical protein JWM64_2996 [Frankiales bacterium]|nr:hypothetical protein [Frankiales bacterium]